MKEEKYLTHKELREIAVEFTLLSLGLAGVILFYSSIRREILYITLILGIIYGVILSFQLYRINKAKKISVRELIIYMNLLAVPFLIIIYIIAYFKDFRIAIVFISFALLSAGFFLSFTRWRSCTK